MKKIFYLKTCSTCQRILQELNNGSGFELQEIKSEPITTVQIEEMAKMAGSYEALFSRRARKYQSMGLKDKNLQEKDFKQLILEEYTFLKRPVIIIGDEIFIGSTKKTIEGLKDCLKNA